VVCVEAVVVDDGSTDGTAAAARSAGATVISLGRNRGNGVAVVLGVDAALRRGADIIVTIDGDGQFDPQHITELVRPLLDDGVGFVTCTRFARKDQTPHMPTIKVWGNRVVTALTNLIARTRLTDSSCGFRAYTREVALKMNTFSEFDYAQEALITLPSRGVKLAEVPLPVRGVREFGESRIAHNLLVFGSNCLSTLLRTLRDFRPLFFFGYIGLGFFFAGFLLGAFVLVHWLRTGETIPYTSFLIGSAVGLLMGVVLAVLALVADSLGRVRRILEEILFLARKASYDAALPGQEPRGSAGASPRGESPVPRDESPGRSPRTVAGPGPGNLAR